VRKRLTFAAVGLLLMLSPAAFWMVSRHHQQDATIEPAAVATTPAAAVAEPAAVSEPRVLATDPLRRHSRLRHGRKLSKHVR
jgi:hypothetical protein